MQRLLARAGPASARLGAVVGRAALPAGVPELAVLPSHSCRAASTAADGDEDPTAPAGRAGGRARPRPSFAAARAAGASSPSSRAGSASSASAAAADDGGDSESDFSELEEAGPTRVQKRWRNVMHDPQYKGIKSLYMKTPFTGKNPALVGGLRGEALIGDTSLSLSQLTTGPSVPLPPQGMQVDYCVFCYHGTHFLRHDNVALLTNFVSDKGQILPKRFTKCCPLHQRRLAHTIRRARWMNLIPYHSKPHPRLRFSSMTPDPMKEGGVVGYVPPAAPSTPAAPKAAPTAPLRGPSGGAAAAASGAEAPAAAAGVDRARPVMAAQRGSINVALAELDKLSAASRGGATGSGMA